MLAAISPIVLGLGIHSWQAHYSSDPLIVGAVTGLAFSGALINWAHREGTRLSKPGSPSTFGPLIQQMLAYATLALHAPERFCFSNILANVVSDVRSRGRRGSLMPKESNSAAHPIENAAEARTRVADPTKSQGLRAANPESNRARDEQALQEAAADEQAAADKQARTQNPR